MSKTLHLPMKGKWHRMISDDIKKEDYRAIKQYWIKRLFYKGSSIRFSENQVEIDGMFYTPIPYDTVTSKNGYSRNSPVTVVRYLGVSIGPAVPEWSNNWPGECFVIKLGEIISITK